MCGSREAVGETPAAQQAAAAAGAARWQMRVRERGARGTAAERQVVGRNGGTSEEGHQVACLGSSSARP